MDRKTFWMIGTVVLVVLLVLVIWQTSQINAFASAEVVRTTSSVLKTGAQSSGGMVGGC